MAEQSGLDAALIDEFIDDYFAECDEHLAAVRTDLLILEGFRGQPVTERAGDGRAGGERGDAGRGLLDALLRAFHSIKGLSGMVGVEHAERLAHEIETALRPLRQEGTVLTGALYEALADSTSLLERVIAARRTGEPIPAIDPGVAQLRSAMEQAPEEHSRPRTTVGRLPASSGAERPALSGEAAARLAQAREAGDEAWHFVFHSSAELAARGVNVNSIRSRLRDAGEVLYAAPRVVGGSGIAFDFLVVTPAGASFEGWDADGLTWSAYDAAEPAGIPATPSAGPAGISPGNGAGPGAARPAGDFPAGFPLAETAAEMPAPTVAPSNIVRVDLARLDELMQWVAELVISRAKLTEQLRQVEKFVPPAQWRDVQDSNLLLERQLRDLREAAMRVRLVPIGEVFTRMQFVVRDVGRATGKKVSIDITGQDTEIDKLVVERMMDPLLHLVRNAVSHGIEPPEERLAAGKPAEGRLSLRAGTAGDLVTIEVQDDGRGIDTEQVAAKARALGLLRSDERLEADRLLDVICAPGFSTRGEADFASGRGVGMTVVRSAVAQLSGSLSLETRPGWGTRFTIRLPLTLAILDAVIVAAAGQTFAVPQLALREVIELPKVVEGPDGGEVVPYRGGALPVVRLARLFDLREPAGRGPRYALVIGYSTSAVGLAVDRLAGQREIVVRPVSDPLIRVPGVMGATELGDGRPILILDAGGLVRLAG